MTYHDTFMLGFRPYEHKYSPGNTDIFACEPQYYLGQCRGPMILKDISMLDFPSY